MTATLRGRMRRAMAFMTSFFLSAIPQADREKLIVQFRRRNAAATKALIADVQKSIRAVRRDGYCAVSWQRGVLAVATPMIFPGLPVYALNMSMQDIEPTAALAAEIGEYLMAFSARCKEALSVRRDDTSSAISGLGGR